MKAKVEYAPDGQHYQTIKTAQTVTRLWDFFCFSRDIRQQISCNPFAKTIVLLAICHDNKHSKIKGIRVW